MVMVGVLIGARHAAADSSSDDTARAVNLFDAGQKLIAAGKIDLACESFEASLANDRALGTMLNLADCRERQGRLVDAYELFSTAADAATRANKSSRIKFARQRASALALRLVQLKLEIAGPDLTGLSIKLDGHEVPRARWTLGVWREPSTIVVEAVAPGRAPFRQEVVGTAGAQIAVDVPQLVPLPEAREARTVLASQVRVIQPLPRTRSLAPFVVGGLGGALAGGGLVLGLHARARYQDELAAELPDLNARLDRPQREADVATVMGIAGTVAIGVGVVLYLRGGRDRVIVAPTASATGTGLTVFGAM